MDISKNINGERWSLTQTRGNEVTIMKGKTVIAKQSMHHRLSINQALNLLSNAPTKFHNGEFEKVVRGKEMETVKEEIKEEIKIEEVPVAHKCLFCNSIPEAIYVTNNDTPAISGALRTLKCNCSFNGHRKRWIYTVDIINDDLVKADTALINEWNKRMPEVMR